MDYRFGKDYKLCSKTTIDAIFSEGRQVKQFPYVVKYKSTESSQKKPFQIVIAAPKRSFRFTYQRNRIKRITKEAIRLNKNELETYLTNTNKQLALFLIYSSKEEVEVGILGKKINKLFNKVITQLKEDDQHS